MIRCRSLPRLEELALAIREENLSLPRLPSDSPEGLKVLRVEGSGPISPDAGHPELKRRLAEANEGDLLIGPFPVGDMHVLLRLDKRITTRLDEEPSSSDSPRALRGLVRAPAASP